MDSTENMNCRMQGTTSVERGISEALLRSEIGFWREMIDTCQESESPDNVERMRYALALAESRLAKNPSNIYHLDI
jgi:hypothetical protein